MQGCVHHRHGHIVNAGVVGSLASSKFRHTRLVEFSKASNIIIIMYRLASLWPASEKHLFANRVWPTHALLEEAAYTQQCMALPYLECCT